MSTWLYLVCLDHNPPLVADDESGQHLYDLPRIRADIATRDALVAVRESGGTPWPRDAADAYFQDHSVNFLAAHPHCHIGIRDEYGAEYPLVEPVTHEPVAPVILGTVTNEGANP